MNLLITIIGPTAIGKTALSIHLAKHFGCEIISCDSRQFYKEMKIGTAVPSEEELSQAPHHFIQNKSILENYTVADFEKEALTKLEELFLNNSVQIMVGGSGLYVNAVLKGFDEFPEIDSKFREQVRLSLETKGIEYLQNQLQKLDGDYYLFLLKNNPQTLKNPQRLMRFLEVCLGTGKPYSTFLNTNPKTRNFTPIIIGLTANRDQLYHRINKRVDTMVVDGLVAEVKTLLPYKNLNALKTVGYSELIANYDDESDDFIDLSTAFEEIKKNTRRFAKRQETWFRRTDHVTWFDYQTPKNDIIEFINTIIKPSKYK